MGICCKGVIMITIEDVNKAQQAWGEGIVAISAAHSSGGDYVALATKHVETLYAYDIGKVLFKPTLAVKEQFRPTFETALSYFVASERCMFRRPRFCN